MKKVLIVLCSFVFLLSCGNGLFAQTQIRISGWPGNPDEEAAITAGVDAFNSSRKDIQVTWEPIPGDYVPTLKTRIAGGTAADLFYVDVNLFEEFARGNTLLPLDSYLKDWSELKNYPKSLIDGFTYNNRLYGIAKDFSTLCVFYNKALFDKAGVKYPTDNWTYKTFYKTLAQLKASGIETPIVMNADLNRMIPFIEAYGGSVVDSNYHIAFNDPKSRTAITDYINLVTKDKLGAEASSVGAGWEAEAFGKENVAMIMSGPWSIGFLKGSYPNVWKSTGVVEMPNYKNKASMIYTVSWSVNRATKNRQAAIEVLKFMTTEGQRIFVEKAGVLGSNTKVAAGDTDPIKQPFYRAAQYGSPWRVSTPSGIFSKANDEINARLKDAFYGKITPDQFIQQVTENYDRWVE